MAITTTNFEVVSTGQEYSVPGDHSPEAIVAAYSVHIQGLASMQFDVSEEGEIRTIVFRPRTGAKG